MTALEILQTLSAYARGEADRRQADAALGELYRVLETIARSKVYAHNAHLREDIVANVVETLTRLTLSRKVHFDGTVDGQAIDYLNKCVLRRLQSACRAEKRAGEPSRSSRDEDVVLAKYQALRAREGTSVASLGLPSADAVGEALEPSHDPRVAHDESAYERALGETEYSLTEVPGARNDGGARDEKYRIPALIELVFNAMLADTEARYHEVRTAAHRCAWVLFYSQAPYAALLDEPEVAAERDEAARARAINTLNHRHARYLDYMRKAAEKLLVTRKLSDDEHATVGRILKLL
jgi:hypothetical protein